MREVSGVDLIRELRARGDALNAHCQRLVHSQPALRRALLDRLHGRTSMWPDAGDAALCKTLAREWTELCVDMRKYAIALTGRKDCSNTAESYESYLRNVVRARLHLEALETPAAAAASSGAACSVRVSATAAAALRADGFALLPAQHDPRLRVEFELLFKHGVIAATASSCNPGAHGVNLRCGTAAERASFARQGTPALLQAISELRGLPMALLDAGYNSPHGTLAVPPIVLVSAYPPGAAHYRRHLDCYGDDNARALTVILYANDADWNDAADGGALVLERADGTTVEVPPSGGTVVAFDARRMWHAVRPARKMRYALTLWVYAEEEPARRVEEAGGGAADAGPTATGGSGDSPLAVLRTDPSSGRTAWTWRSECG